jgi:hypothetical protein
MIHCLGPDALNYLNINMQMIMAYSEPVQEQMDIRRIIYIHFVQTAVDAFVISDSSDSSADASDITNAPTTHSLDRISR